MNKLNHDPWWQEHFFPQAGGKPCDYIARDGKTLIAVQESPQGTRGLYNEAMQLALSLANRPEIERACLVLLVSRLSMERVQREWTSIKGVLQPDVARRLSLAAIGKTDWWVEPNEELVRRIAKVFQATKDGGFDATATIVKPRAKQKHLEVLKVLIGRWLLREGSIPVGKLAEQVGCAYSTVKEALDQLRQRKVIVRNSDRSVELAKFPMSSWSEMLVLSRNLRQTFRYRDASGEKPDPKRLLERLERLRPLRVAVGGAVAARHWQADFDLHGIPRIDLLLHAPGASVDLEFVGKLDPALQRIQDDNESPTLVIRLLQRAEPLFQPVPGTSLPIADPVETALDLNDLGLSAQANQLFAHFRPEIRLR